MANPAIVVDFVANTKDLARGFQDVSGRAGGFGSKLKGLGKTAAFAAGSAALGGLVATVKAGIGEYTQATKVTAQTAAAIKSTGGAAHVSVKSIKDLAGAIMSKSGIDDEAIQSGENLLLTFTRVRNEAGKGNDVFNQATRVMADMSTALGQDMKSSAIQLGKALNDPVKGITALRRVGVSFTAAQQAQIKALVASGDQMGAQKLILRELNKEFGGSAAAAGKTLPGQLKILNETFKNFAGELIAKMIPALTAVAGLMLKHKNVVIGVIAVVAALTVTTLAVTAATAAWNAIQLIAKGATAAWTAVQWLLNAALLANPIGLVIVAVVALVAAFVIAYKTSDTFRAIVQAAFGAVLNAAETVFNWIKGNWPLLLAIITGPMGLAVLAVVRNWDTIKGAVTAAINAVKSVVGAGWDAIRNASQNAWNAVSGFVKDAAAAVRSALSSLSSWISGFASGIWATVVSKVGGVFDRIGNAAHDAAQAVRDALNNLVDWFGGVIDRIGNAASRLANAIKAPINAVLRAWNSIQLQVPSIKIPSIKVGGHKIGGGSIGGFTVSFPNVGLLAKGGVVSTPTLAVVGEGAGREIVTPEALLRQIVGEGAAPQVRVFIGETELRGLVRTEVVDQETGIARALLAGAMR